MISATFTFAKGEFDDAFDALDTEIAHIAKSIPCYLGEEAWVACSMCSPPRWACL
jgi:hypothetical protein